LLLLFGAVFWWLLPPESVLNLDNTVEGTVAWIRSLGGRGVAGAIALMVAHSFLPFPAEIIAVANGMLYGPLWGTVVIWAGAMLGATVAFALVWLLGRPALFRLLSSYQSQALEHWSRERGAMALLVARLVPVIAFNLVNYGAALRARDQPRGAARVQCRGRGLPRGGRGGSVGAARSALGRRRHPRLREEIANIGRTRWISD